MSLRTPKFCCSLLASAVVLSAVLAATPVCTGQEDPQADTLSTLPLPTHIVIVVEENHGYSEIIGSSQAPYINTLADEGASFTSSHAITHPSQPNYLALFSGSTQGITDDSCPHTFSTPNLAGELEAASYTFGGFSEDMPSTGSTVCTSGEY